MCRSKVSTTCSASRPHEAVVDEDAGELVADGAVHERRRDGGVDAARERADHAVVANLLADTLDLLLDEVARRPSRRRLADSNTKLSRMSYRRRVHDLRMELDAEEPRRRCSIAAKGEVSEEAVAETRPARGMRSPCVIQTGSARGTPAKIGSASPW